jgi:hypothetical protein
MTETSIQKCKKEGCKIEENGKCLEGHIDLEKCPHYIGTGQDMRETEPSRQIPSESPAPPKMIDLPSGEDLDFGLANTIMAAAITRVIVLAGAVKSGKTTVLASIHEKFQEGDFAGYIFAGSDTLVGFERRCYLSRIASGRTEPATERSKPGFEQVLLHLKVREKELSGPVVNMLFQDISGETFRMARDSTEDCKRLQILRRADHVVLFIDGEKLAQDDKRQEAFMDAELLLRSCIESGMLGRKSFVEVLFSKVDLLKVQKPEEEEKVKRFQEHVKKTLNKRYMRELGSLRIFSVAARPITESMLPFGFGLKEIFSYWVETTPIYVREKINHQDDINIRREFDRYLLKSLRTSASGE